MPASCLQGARTRGPCLRAGPHLGMEARQSQDLPPALPSWGLLLSPRAPQGSPSSVANTCSHYRPCSHISPRPLNPLTFSEAWACVSKARSAPWFPLTICPIALPNHTGSAFGMQSTERTPRRKLTATTSNKCTPPHSLGL